MMFRLLIKKAFLESWLLLAACGLMVFAFCWTRVWIVTRFELQRFQGFLEQLRQFEQFMPVPLEQVLTYAGSLALTFDEPVLILCVLVWSISRGSDVVSGELGRGTLEMLLAQPIGRLKLLFVHSLVSVMGVALLTALAWLWPTRRSVVLLHRNRRRAQSCAIGNDRSRSTAYSGSE